MVKHFYRQYRWRDFLPLIVVLISVFIFTLLHPIMEYLFFVDKQIDFSIHELIGFYKKKMDIASAMRFFMGYFFIIFGCFKLINIHRFVVSYREYDIIAKRVYFYGYLYPFIELSLGIAYLTNFFPLLRDSTTLFFTGISSIGVFRVLRKKKHISCACLGSVFKIPMTHITLIEDLIMVSMSFAMLCYG